MKNLRFTFYSIVTYLVVSIVLFSCCQEYTIKILGEGGELKFATLCQDVTSFDCNIEGPFSIIYSPRIDIVSNIVNPQLITSAYGTSCEPAYLNSLDPASISLVFSTDFKNASGQVSKGTNLNGLENIEVRSDPEGATFFFQEGFFDQLELESDSITVDFNGSTDDKIILSASTEIIFEL